MGDRDRGGWGKRQMDCGDGSISDRQQLSLFITWTGEASKEKALEDLPRMDEKGPSPIRPIWELFQQQWWETFWEMGVEHMGFPQWLASILNWSELSLRVWQSTDWREWARHDKELPYPAVHHLVFSADQWILLGSCPSSSRWPASTYTHFVRSLHHREHYQHEHDTLTTTEHNPERSCITETAINMNMTLWQ